MPSMTQGKDARGRLVLVDDTVIDKGGEAYIVCWTEKGLRKQRSARAEVKGVGSHTRVDLTRVFRVKKASATERQNKARWKRMWDKYVRPERRRVARRRRKAEASHHMWKCPVCIKGYDNGSGVVRFKIGIPVWRGKKLRVCSIRCKRKVQRRVKAGEHGDRRKVAYNYMKKGGQLE